MGRINSTQPHYIRCLKPNDSNQPSLFNERRVAEQLRYGGVLEAVRVARSGFPVRMPHSDFYQRYRGLVANAQIASAPVDASSANAGLPLTVEFMPAATAEPWTRKLLALLGAGGFATGPSSSEEQQQQQQQPPDEVYEESGIQFGTTKVFMRKHAHDALEARRSRRRATACIRIQARQRAAQVYRVYRIVQVAVRLLQRTLRGYVGRRRALVLRITAAVVLVQRNMRRSLAMWPFVNIKYAATCLQALKRGQQARLVVYTLRREASARLLQRVGRGAIARRRTSKLRSAIISVQCAARRRTATAVRRRLLAAARDVGSLKNSNEELKNEIARLKEDAARAATEREEKARAEAASEVASEAEALRRRVSELVAALDGEKKRADTAEVKATDLSEKLRDVQQQLVNRLGGEQRRSSGATSSIDGDVGSAGMPSILSSESNNLLAQLKDEQRKRKALQDQVERMLLGGGISRLPQMIDTSSTSPQLKSRPRTISTDGAMGGRNVRSNSLPKSDVPPDVAQSEDDSATRLYPGANQRPAAGSPSGGKSPSATGRFGSPDRRCGGNNRGQRLRRGASMPPGASPSRKPATPGGDADTASGVTTPLPPPPPVDVSIVSETELDAIEAELSPKSTRQESSEGPTRVSSLVRRNLKVTNVYGSLDDQTKAMNFDLAWDHEGGGSSDEDEEEDERASTSSPGMRTASPTASAEQQRSAVAATVRAATPQARPLNADLKKVSSLY
jgi:hypothetical protein